MYKCPINFYHNNLIFNSDKSCWAVFKIQGFNYEFLSEEGKKQINWRLARYLGGISSYAQLHIIPIEQDVDSHYERLIGRLDPDDPLHQSAKSYNQQVQGYLKKGIQAKAEANDYGNYICVKLQMSADEVELAKEAVAYFIKDPINALNSWMFLDTRDILQSRIEECQDMAKNWFEQQQEVMRMVPASKKETQWLLRRTFYRGMPEHAVQLWHDDTEGTDAWQPGAEIEEGVLRPEKTIINLFDGNITPCNRYLKVETEAGTSYQSFLVMSHFPDSIQNPGKEWIYKLQEIKVKPEICIHFEAVDAEKALKKVGDKQQEIGSQMEHVLEAGARVPQDLRDGARDGVRLENEIKKNRDPLLVTTVQFCIASEELDDMQARVRQVRSFFKGWQFVVERPAADQLKLFFNFIPSVSNGVKGYARPLTTLAAASGIFGATHTIGDAFGGYIGTTAGGMKKVFLDLSQACLRNMSAAATFLGNLGVGKSYNANLLLLIAVLNGACGLAIDPKGERSHWPEELSILRGYINLITIDSEPENRGVLDPYNIYREDIEAATELAINVILELCKVRHGTDAYIALKEAAAIVKRDGRTPCMHTLTLVLEEWDKSDSCHAEAIRLARLIRAEKEVGMGQLIYGYGDEKTIHLDNRLNIIQIQNMKMPERDTQKEDYTAEEVVSSVIMMVLAQFAKKFALRNRGKAEKQFQVILIDESWILKKTKQGKDLYAFLVRMGRSLFTAPIFNGHSVLDVDDVDIRNGVTYRFCFQTNDEEEARRMLDYLGLEISPANVKMMQGLPNRECMFRDADGSVGRLRFDVVFKNLDDVFNTTPKEKKQDSLLTKEVL